MKSITIKSVLRNMFRPARKSQAPPRRTAFRPMLERLEDRTVPSAPTVTGLSPNYGPTNGGNEVVVTGTNFTDANLVSFGDLGAQEFSVVSDTTIDVWAPAENAGTVDVTVANPDGTSATSSADNYTYGTTTTTSLSSSDSTTTYGESVTFTATVTGDGGTPTGTVWFDDGGNVLGSASLDSYTGAATFTTSDLAVRNHSITAYYGGDANYVASASGTVTQTVQTASTTTTVSSSAQTSDPGQAVTFTAEVDGADSGVPTGTVTFYDGATALGTGTLNPGGNGSQATFTTSTLSSGSHSITAAYGGDGNYAGSTSSALTQTVEDNGAYVWTGDVSSDWGTAGNWLVNGVVATQAPSSSSDVIFDGALGTDNNCATSVAKSVNSITIDSNYTGTITLNATLSTVGMDMEGGTISQPGGAGVSDIDVTGGFFNWAAGILNSSAAR